MYSDPGDRGRERQARLPYEVSMPQSPRVIVVDDNYIIVEILDRVLSQQANAIVSVARDGSEAISIAENIKPDLIFLDLKLPTLSGFEVLRLLKEKGITTRIVAMSGEFLEHRDVVACVQWGACDFLVKPFTVEEAVSTMKRALIIGSPNIVVDRLPNLQAQLLRAYMEIKKDYESLLERSKEHESHIDELESENSRKQMQLQKKEWILKLLYVCVTLATSGVLFAIGAVESGQAFLGFVVVFMFLLLVPIERLRVLQAKFAKLETFLKLDGKKGAAEDD